MKSPIPAQDNLFDDESDIAMYERMLNISHTAIISLDVDMRIISVSSSISGIIGYEAESLIGKIYSDLIAEDYRTPFNNLVKNHDVDHLDYPLVDNQGEWQWVHHSGEYINKDNTTRYDLIIQDVSQYKRPHNQAESERNMLREVMDNLPAAIYATDANGKFIFCNRAHAKLLGKVRAAELLGLTYSDIFPKNLRLRFEAQDHEVITTGRSTSSEERFDSHDGKEIWVSANKIPMHDTKGRINGVIGISRDITHEKRSQQRLEGSEARHRALLDALPDMMFVVRLDGVVTEFRSNPEVESLGIDESIVGKHLSDTNFPAALIDEAVLYLDVEFDARYVHSFEFGQSLNEDGDEYFEARLIRLNKDEVMALVRNVTPLKRIQDELSRHIDDLTIVRQVNVELSANLNINYVAQLALDAALRLSNAQAGYLVMIQASGHLNLMSQFGQYDFDLLEQTFLKKQGIISRVIESLTPELIFNVHADPDYIPMLDKTEAMMVIPLLSNERIVGVLVLEARRAERFSHERFQFLQLITGRIAAFLDNAMLYRQTEEQYEAVRNLEQLKTDMIRIASHDLKNPLAGIMGYIEMLRMDVTDKLDDKERGYLDKIEVAAKKMQRITTGILSLERIQQLSEQQSHKIVNLKKLVHRSVSEQMDYAVRSEQKLHRHLPDEDVYIQGDPLQMHEALSNLVQNAIKYTAKHGTVDVSLVLENGIAKVRVIDTGYGIPKDQQERLFSPFFRAKTVETRFIEGTGLGLHLVKNIVERHNGTMVFESEYGKGSTFGFDISIIATNTARDE